MTLNFENEYGSDLGLEPEKLGRRVFEEAMEYMDCPYEAEVNLLVTGDAQIQELNRQFRQIDRATDVLSFPMVPFTGEASFSDLENETDEEDEFSDCFNPETGELLLGDIVISGDKVLSQAASFGHSIEREYAFLITHSLLHLLGYDHETPEQEERMEKLQEDILGQLGISR